MATFRSQGFEITVCLIFIREAPYAFLLPHNQFRYLKHRNITLQTTILTQVTKKVNHSRPFSPLLLAAIGTLEQLISYLQIHEHPIQSHKSLARSKESKASSTLLFHCLLYSKKIESIPSYSTTSTISKPSNPSFPNPSEHPFSPN